MGMAVLLGLAPRKGALIGKRYINLCYSKIMESGGSKRRGDEVSLTVDQVARLAGTTTRNVRAFQTLGLLPRPALQGRTGHYGREHLERLKAILRLQRAGFSLGAVGTLFAAWEQGMTLEQLLGMPAATAGRRGADADDGLGAFDDWPLLRAVDGLAVVPTTVLDQVAS
jgi:DNA-binding transcriptional MerR regulator